MFALAIHVTKSRKDYFRKCDLLENMSKELFKIYVIHFYFK